MAQAVQRGAVEELSVDEVAANVWNACNVSRNSARTVARTIINGVSNAARAETLFANDDVIDGIEFLATLDARTSHICGALDGTVWRGDEMKRARRPPLHPNCRSTLIPVVDLIDPETGEKSEETAERPAQNADGSYSQVAAKTTFKDYFELQPETFQREWLGEKRFELWKSGKLKFEDLAKPATTYRATPADLTPPTEKAKETAASDDNTNNGFALHPINYKTLPPIDFFGLRKASDKSAALAARRDAVDELNADDAEKRALDLGRVVIIWHSPCATVANIV
ncbi:MAG: minor capsid protein [Thermoguttaceae bacterium]|nr:minor capsid protein [Thermoguttaceae bacterium]